MLYVGMIQYCSNDTRFARQDKLRWEMWPPGTAAESAKGVKARRRCEAVSRTVKGSET